MATIKLGITGSRFGMNGLQMDTFISLLQDFKDKGVLISEFHQGQCLGVDVDSVPLVLELFPDCKVISHPPTKTHLVGNCTVHETREPRSYLVRDRNIVNESDMLIAIPFDSEYNPRSGTWYTHNYAKSLDKSVILITK